MSNVCRIECARCEKQLEPGRPYHLCLCGSPLLVRYRLDSSTMPRASLSGRTGNLWRYREVLPVERIDSVVSMGEGFTPLLHARGLGGKLGLPNLYLKDEGVNPTGSFKARGLAVAISMAREFGIQKVSVPSAGNAGGALAAYAARAGLKSAGLYAGRHTGRQSPRMCSARR